jgi:hypothetical protein
MARQPDVGVRVEVGDVIIEILKLCEVLRTSENALFTNPIG